jgi:hypothetical protein
MFDPIAARRNGSPSSRRDPGWLATLVTHLALFDYHPEFVPSGLPCDPDAARRFLETQ